MKITKFEDFQNSLIPNVGQVIFILVPTFTTAKIAKIVIMMYIGIQFSLLCGDYLSVMCCFRSKSHVQIMIKQSSNKIL